VIIHDSALLLKAGLKSGNHEMTSLVLLRKMLVGLTCLIQVSKIVFPYSCCWCCARRDFRPPVVCLRRTGLRSEYCWMGKNVLSVTSFEPRLLTFR
jgi:hypothetical protein